MKENLKSTWDNNVATKERVLNVNPKSAPYIIVTIQQKRVLNMCEILKKQSDERES